MPKVLTEVATWTPSVTVPVGTDTRANAAEVVEAIAQALANRSQYVKPLIDGAAQRGADNTFSATQNFNGATNFADMLFVNNTNAERALLSTNTRPSDSTVANNKWKLLIEARSGATSGGGQYVRVYSGRDGTTAGNGAIAITVNAIWVVSSQRWEARDTALKAHALIWRYDGVYVAAVAAGVANWADWPLNPYTAGASSVLFVRELQAAIANIGTVNASGITSQGDITIPYNKRVRYSGTREQRTRDLTIPLYGYNVNPAGAVLNTNGDLYASVNCTVVVPLPRIPTGAELIRIWVDHRQQSAHPASVYKLVYRYMHVSGGYHETTTHAASADTVFDAEHMFDWDLLDLTVGNEVYSYYVVMDLKQDTTVYGMILQFSDPGLSSE